MRRFHNQIVPDTAISIEPPLNLFKQGVICLFPPQRIDRHQHFVPTAVPAQLGGGALRVSLAEVASFNDQPAADLVALDEALTALAEVDQRKGQVVEMRFFGGLSVEEVAEVLKVSKETVMRDWRLAKVWLLRRLGQEASVEG